MAETLVVNVTESTGDPSTPSNPWDDATWILTSTFIIFTMQSGFGMLESGCVSQKHECNIMIKNCMDVVFGGLSYWILGYALSFGRSWHGLVGYSHFFTTAETSDIIGDRYAQYFYQLAFCTTATTIVSGALAERFNFFCYMIFSLFNTLIYCVPAHWIWSTEGWLYKWGAVDVGGSGVVHMLGGLTGLVGSWMVGPRTGRFDPNFKRDFERMNNPTNCLLGMFILWWGWLGFNCGSTYGVAGSKWKLASVAAVTTINASVAGGFVSFVIAYFVKKGKFDLGYLACGTLGALVSITAQCPVVEPVEAMVVGAIGSVITILTREGLPRYFKIDDPVGTASIHGAAGAWGAIAVAFFAHKDITEEMFIPETGIFRGGNPLLLVKQLVYVLSVAAWVIATTFIILKVLDLLIGIRADLVVELIGADVVEHCVGGSYNEKTKVLSDELHESVGQINVHSPDLINELLQLYRKLLLANKRNYILKIQRGIGADDDSDDPDREHSGEAEFRKVTISTLQGSSKETPNENMSVKTEGSHQELEHYESVDHENFVVHT